MKRIRVGITGASGFIGKHFVEFFLRDGYDVVAYARDPQRLNFAGKNKKLSIVEGRMEDRKSLERFVAACDAIVHLAAGTRGAWDEYYTATVTGTENLLSLAQKNHLKKILVMSSIGNYDILRIPRGVVTEETALERRPELRGHYAHAKVLAEQCVLQRMKSSALPIILFRAGLVYARNMKTPLMGCGIRRGNRMLALGIARKRMPFVHIEDLYAATKMAVESDTQQAIYNVVSDEEPRIKSIVAEWNKYATQKVRILSVPKFFFSLNHLLLAFLPATSRLGRYNFLLCRTQKNVRYSADKIKRELGWLAKKSFSETMKDIALFHTKPVRAGVMGCGFAFQTLHAPVLLSNPRIRVVFLYDQDRALAERAREIFPDASIPDSFDAITKEAYDADFVSILTPPQTHFAIARVLMERGYHLLIEKPVTLTLKQARELEVLREASGVRVCVANNYRFRGNVRSLIGAAPSTPNEVYVKFWSGPVIQSKRGWRNEMKNALLYEMAYHFIDIALMLAGRNEKILHSEKNFDEKKILTALSLVAETERKSRLLFDCRLFPPYAETYIEARYSDKAYRASFYPEEFEVLAGGTNPIREIKKNVVTIARYARRRLTGDTPSHAELYRLFINAVRDPYERVPVSIGDVLPTMEVLEKLSR